MLRTIIAAAFFSLLFLLVAHAVGTLLPTIVAVPWFLAAAAGFLRWHLRDGDEAAHRRDVVRSGRPSGRRSLIGVAITSTLLIQIGIALSMAIFLLPEIADAPDTAPVDLLDYSLTGWIARVCETVLLTAIVEECCFRGYVQHTLEGRMAPWRAIVITAAFWSALHGPGIHWLEPVIYLAGGMGMGAVAYLFNSVWVPIAIHGIWNLTLVSLAALAGRIAGQRELIPADPTDFKILLLLLSVSAMLAGALGWYLVLQGRGRRGSSSTDGPPDPVRVSQSGQTGRLTSGLHSLACARSPFG